MRMVQRTPGEVHCAEECRTGPCTGSFRAIAHVLLLCVGGLLIEDGVALDVDCALVRHDVFHADATMLANLSMRNTTIFKQLDQNLCRLDR